MSTTFHKTTNNAAGTLSAGIDADDLALTLQADEGAEFPADAECPCFGTLFVDDIEAGEIVEVSARSTDTLTIARAQQGTVAKDWPEDTNFQLLPTAGQFDELQTGINNIETGVTSHDKILVAAGAAATPAIQMGGDTTTGWYRSAANEIAAAIATTVRFILSATGLAITGVITATGNITSTGGTIHAQKAAGNAILKIENSGNGNWSIIQFIRERLSGAGMIGGVLRVQSSTADDQCVMEIGVNSGFPGDGLGSMDPSISFNSNLDIITATCLTFFIEQGATFQAGATAGAVAARFGATATEGLEVKVLDEVVSLTSAGAKFKAMTTAVPAGAVILSVQGNIASAITAGGTSVAVSLGLNASDPDKYGFVNALTQNSKINNIPDWAVLSGATTIDVCATIADGTTLGNTNFSAGSVRVRVVYLANNSLDNAA
jgi:hypothetical protein